LARMIPLSDDNPSELPPIVTISLIMTCTLVFLWQLSHGTYGSRTLVYSYGLIPSVLFGIRTLPPELVAVPPALTVLTSMFLHGGWMHVLGNMWFLWIFGDNVEDILGHGKYLAFYLLCGVAAAFTQVFFDPSSRVPMVGASGAIAGVMGAYMVKFPQSRIRTLVFIVIFITMADIPAWVMLIYWFFLQFVGGFESLATQQMMQGGTAFFAHVGGFLSGIAFIHLLRAETRYKRRRDLYW
jgi:membrane associated rhomboid family serine protease